jgi:hypothetical protein
MRLGPRGRGENCCLTAGVTRWWAGVDNAWEQYKLEARKILLNRAEPHQSAARCVGQPFRRLNHAYLLHLLEYDDSKYPSET